MQYLIDASVYVFRAYYSMPDDMVDGDGNPINALYGFCRFLGDFIEQVNPEHVAVAFDESLTTSFRTTIYPEYKANREPAPVELKRQFSRNKRDIDNKCLVCRHLDICRGGCPKDRLAGSGTHKAPSYFCEGYKLFFDHTLGHFRQLATQLQRQHEGAGAPPTPPNNSR